MGNNFDRCNDLSVRFMPNDTRIYDLIPTAAALIALPSATGDVMQHKLDIIETEYHSTTHLQRTHSSSTNVIDYEAIV